MKYSERLNTLMNIYRLSNITLARGIGVDASLVSRWRSGERVPKRTSSAPGDIAAFIAGLGMLQHDRDTLIKLLGVPCESREQTQTAIQAWLQGRSPAASAAMDPESPELVSAMFNRLSNVFQADARSPTGPVNLYPRVLKGELSNHERFHGYDGLRQAVINFLHVVLTNRTPSDVYLLPPADDSWLNDGGGFEALYTNALRTVIQSGHTVHMVHPAPHGSALGPLLSTYMPLYTTGRFFSYGRADTAQAHLPGIFVLKNHAAAVSYDFAGQCVTMLYHGKGDIPVFENMIFAQMGRQLAAACPREAPHRLAELLIQLEDRPGALFAVKNTLDAVFLPEKLLYKLLSSQLQYGVLDKHLDLLARRREALLRHMESQPWSILLPGSVIDAILINGTCRISGIELLTPRDVTLSGDELLEYLNSLLSLMERYPLLKVMFVDDCPTIDLTVKEGVGTFFMADSVESQPSAVYVGDLTLCEALYRWFSARTRDEAALREQAVAQLSEAASYL